MTNAEVAETADIWERAVKNIPDAIELATVYTEPMNSQGKLYAYRFYGKDRDLVEKYSARQAEMMGKYQNLTLSAVQPFRDGFACVVELGKNHDQG